MDNNFQIYKSLNEIHKKIRPIAKNQKNAHQGYAYRGYEDLYNAISPLLAEHNVVCIPVVLDKQVTEAKKGGNQAWTSTELTMEYRFVSAIDRSEVSVIARGEGLDNSDKGIGKAMSYAHKYALMQLFMIPTQDVMDPDKEHHVVEKTKIDPKDVIENASDDELAIWFDKMNAQLKQYNATKKDPPKDFLVKFDLITKEIESRRPAVKL